MGEHISSDRLAALIDPNHPDVQVHQDHQIGPYSVVALDGAFNASEQEELATAFKRVGYRRSERDRDDTRQRSLNATFQLNEMARLQCVKRMIQIGRILHGDEALRPFRVYMNNNSYGDMSHIHVDSQPHQPTVTVMAYAQPNWEPEWAGETLFYDANQDPVVCVAPRFGRLVVFNGEVPHKGGIPSRECYAERLSFVVKLANKTKFRDA